jgi:hypothetical protein
MANWRWYHVAILWLGGIIIGVAALALSGSGFRGSPTAGSGGIAAAGAPLWVVLVVLALLLALLIVTASWLRAH